MILIIGVDNSGKTTLANQLSKNIPGSKITKSCGPIEEAKQRIWVMEQLAIVGEERIYDRFCLLDELIYGPILRNHSNFDYCDIIKLLPKEKAFIVYCRPTPETILETINERPQMEGVIENQDDIITLFDLLATKLWIWGYNIITYDFKRDSVDKVIRGYWNGTEKCN